MPRNRLPNRRPNISLILQAHGQPYTITIGQTDTTITEVFIDPHKQNASDTANILHDVGVILSIALQWGIPLDELQRATLRLPDNTPSSAIGSILDLLRNHLRVPVPGTPHDL